MLEIEQILILGGRDHRARGIHQLLVVELVVRENHEHPTRAEHSGGLLSQVLALLGVAGSGRYNGERQVDRSLGRRFVHGLPLVCAEHAVQRR
ncbi:hypothetical protein [Saccharopolyspora rhizosphaerae]|uniref:hypothetical protein n=1 Tax=Saccharopolyspora rhizosphaerae TaxID=2492662 RepID=UPI00131507FC|nr:hypothetical protein [Saccharopolyspora rhizosphaerae]